MQTPKQFNNITERVIDDLKASLTPKSRLSIAAASFSIYAFEALKDELKQIEELRFIFTAPTFNKDKERKQSRQEKRLKIIQKEHKIKKKNIIYSKNIKRLSREEFTTKICLRFDRLISKIEQIVYKRII